MGQIQPSICPSLLVYGQMSASIFFPTLVLSSLEEVELCHEYLKKIKRRKV